MEPVDFGIRRGRARLVRAVVCGIFVAKELCMFLMMGMPISSEALHLNGFVIGGIVGLATLYFGWVDCEGFDLISLWTGSKFKANRIRNRERREQLAAIEAAQPKGPPQAIVPKLPHQLTDVGPPDGRRKEAARETITRPSPSRVGTPPAPKRPPSPVAKVKPMHPIDAGLSLPEFDDGSRVIDPTAQAKSEIETMVARGQFASAARRLGDRRKQDRTFVVSAASIGRLAEGLVKAGHIRAAITVLAIGCREYPEYEARWRIRIASLELTAHRDPIAAIKQLQLVDKEMLDTKLRDQYLKVARQAKGMAGH